MQQKITILNKQGEKLNGVLHDTGSTYMVVLCHGLRSSKENHVQVNLAVALENEGISAFRFDCSPNGTENWEYKDAMQYDDYSSEVEDIRAVIEYFSGVNRLTVAVLGHSKGANIVLYYASKYHDIGAVINISGRYDRERGNEECLDGKYLERLKKDGHIDVKTGTDYQVIEESMMEQLNTNMHEKAWLSIHQGCRVLTVHGSADEIVPLEDALDFAKIMPNHRLEIVEGANHGYSSHQDELASVILRFIKELLQDVEDVPK